MQSEQRVFFSPCRNRVRYGALHASMAGEGDGVVTVSKNRYTVKVVVW